MSTYRVTFGDGTSLYVRAESHDGARVVACFEAWKVCGYWPTVLAVMKEAA